MQTHTYEGDGNLVREVAVSPGGTTTYSTTIGKTDTVCRQAEACPSALSRRALRHAAGPRRQAGRKPGLDRAVEQRS